MSKQQRTTLKQTLQIIVTGLWCSVVCYQITHRNPLPPQTEQMKSQMRNEGLYLILTACVRILSKTPGETANPANLSSALV